jgi:hypothetical protein
MQKEFWPRAEVCFAQVFACPGFLVVWQGEDSGRGAPSFAMALAIRLMSRTFENPVWAFSSWLRLIFNCWIESSAGLLPQQGSRHQILAKSDELRRKRIDSARYNDLPKPGCRIIDSFTGRKRPTPFWD